MRNLDFVVIGGQRCGTTTLFDMLRAVPGIALPPTKEAPIFQHGGVTASEVAAYLDANFADVEDALCGTITPQYCAGFQAAPQLSHFFPRAKILLLTRDRVERSYSHYWLIRARGEESRSFGDAISSQLTARGRSEMRSSMREQDTYVAWSEFGRIITMYGDYFPRDQIMVQPMEGLVNAPTDALGEIARFLGIEQDASAVLDSPPIRNAGTTIVRVTNARARFGRLPGSRSVWRHLPEHVRDRVAYTFDRWNRSTVSTPPPLEAEVDGDLLGRLRSYFAEDETVLTSFLKHGPSCQA